MVARPNQICPKLLAAYMIAHPTKSIETILKHNYDEVRCLGKGDEGTKDDEKLKGMNGCMMFDYSSGRCTG